VPSFKPKHKPVSSGEAFSGVSHYRGDYVGQFGARPNAVRPRSAHRDNVNNEKISGETTVRRSYRDYSNDERKSARIKFKRLGSSHGHVDPNNEAIFKGTSTVNTDYIKQPFSRATQIKPHENNIELGKDESDHNTSHRLDYPPIIGNVRQTPIVPASRTVESKYEVPYVSTTRGDYMGHKGLYRSANFAPDRRYEPSSTPLEGSSSYTGAYQKWAPKSRDALPWADIAKQRTNILHKGNSGTENSCYSTDYPGRVTAKRVAIKPEQFAWTDRPKFDGTSLYKQQYLKKPTERVVNYKPNRSYSKPEQPVDGVSTSMDSYRGDFIMPPKPCLPAGAADRETGPMAKSTEYGDRFNSQ